MKKYLTLLFFIASFFVAFNAYGADVHDCDTAVCGQTPGNGSTWSVALDDLPTNLTRGNTYWIADGSYAAHRFNDACVGDCDETDRITIKKATASAHGSETGWDNAYGDGQAAFAHIINFTKSYYTWDGMVGSGTDSTSYGFIITQSCPQTKTTQLMGVPGIGYSTYQVSYVAISHTALISCGGDPCQDYSENSIYSYADAGYDTQNITISNNYMYNGSSFILGTRAKNWIIENNIFDTNWSGNSTRPECVGVDGDNGQMYASNISSDWIVRGNIFKDGKTFINGAHYATNIRHQIYNNIIIGGTYTAGFSTATASQTDWVKQWDVHHNTFIGVAFTVTTARGAVFSGTMSDPTTDHNHVYNNLFYDCDNPRLDPAGYTAGQNVHDYNAFLACSAAGGEIPNETHGQIDAEATTDIFTDYENGDYTINASSQVAIAHIIGKGKTDLDVLYKDDKAGNERDATPDMGAFEAGASADTTPPTISSATINTAGDTLTIAFPEIVNVTTSTGFTLTMSGGAAGLTYSSGSGTSALVYIITGRNIDTAETGTLDYVTVANGIEDASGNDLASTGETDEAVTNNSTQSPSATTYIVTVQSSGNCVVSPLSNKVIVSGETASYTCTANGNSGCAAWTGTCGGTGTTSFTSSAITANCTVIQSCYKISPDATLGAGAATALGTGAVGTLY